MTRFEELREIFRRGEYFKIVCGAGNEDPQEVYLLSIVYTLSGANGIDISANEDVVNACVRGIEKAYETAPSIGVKINTRPFINVSVGLKGDPHVRKARFDKEKCTDCGVCFKQCEQLAIEERTYQVITARCIGCGKCEEACDFGAVKFYTRKVDFNEILPKCLSAGAENLELHAIIADEKPVMRNWKVITDLVPDQYVSMCVDRSQLSNDRLVERIRHARELTGERLIIQADGAPMSGGSDDYNTTLQAVAIADIVQKSGIPLMLLLSGGTNSRSGEMARACGLSVHGVSIGTYARNLVRNEIQVADFESNIDAISEAVKKAKWLVDANINQIKRVEHGRCTVIQS